MNKVFELFTHLPTRRYPPTHVLLRASTLLSFPGKRWIFIDGAKNMDFALWHGARNAEALGIQSKKAPSIDSDLVVGCLQTVYLKCAI